MTYRASCTHRSHLLALLAGLLLMGVLFVEQAQAQECPFTEDEAVADTLDPKGYYPLEIGNVWEYISDSAGFVEEVRREEIVADTLIEDITFYMRKSTRYEWAYPITEIRSISIDYIAVTDSSLLLWSEDAGVTEQDMRFNQAFQSCYEGFFVGLEERFVGVTGSYDTEIFIEEEGEAQSYKIEALKYFFIGGIVSSGYGYGIGIVDSGAEINNSTKLLYAKVDDHEIGIPLNERFDIRVNSEPSPILRKSRLAVYPNPAHALTHFRFVLSHPGRTSVRVYDVQGRLIATSVEESFFSPGIYTVAWNVESVASGVYVVWLTVEGHPVAHGRLVVVH